MSYVTHRSHGDNLKCINKKLGKKLYDLNQTVRPPFDWDRLLNKNVVHHRQTSRLPSSMLSALELDSHTSYREHCLETGWPPMQVIKHWCNLISMSHADQQSCSTIPHQLKCLNGLCRAASCRVHYSNLEEIVVR